MQMLVFANNMLNNDRRKPCKLIWNIIEAGNEK